MEQAKLTREIFVFGSNLGGRHGAGSARAALDNWGAKYGQGVGLQGNSYAIPTKDAYFNVLPLSSIQSYVNEFLQFAEENPHLKFNVVAIGCGLAGYLPSDIKPLFTSRKVPANVHLPEEFR